jgi:O-antigen/teichoic acid export membrane protein
MRDLHVGLSNQIPDIDNTATLNCALIEVTGDEYGRRDEAAIGARCASSPAKSERDERGRVSRARRALTAAGFTYAQTALSVAVNLYLVRFLLDRLGASTWGLWIASGSLLGYAGFADLGVFAILPWLVAEADGQDDRMRLRSLLMNGILLGAVVGALFLTLAALLWNLFPSVLHLSTQDRAVLTQPLLFLATATAVGYPLRAFTTVLVGLQDYLFTGIAGLIQVLLNAGLVIGLMSRGYGLFAVAAGAAIPQIALGLASLVRILLRQRDLFGAWQRPQLTNLRPLLSSALGAWLGSVGWTLVSASDVVVIAYLGHRDLVAVYAVTSRMGLTLMQLAWTLPDSTMVGLAQLNSGGPRPRVIEVTSAVLRLNLYLGGGVACLILGMNPGFVRVWAGANLFGGAVLNAVFALVVVGVSFLHGLVVPMGVLGNRLLMGAGAMAQGLVHIACALILGRLFGLPGVALAVLVSGLMTTFPVGARLFIKFTGHRPLWFAVAVIAPWLRRWAPVGALAVLGGWCLRGAHARWFPVTGALLGLIWLWRMRPLFADLPLGDSGRRLLERLRLIAPEHR